MNSIRVKAWISVVGGLHKNLSEVEKDRLTFGIQV